jgi:hypothetical protein
MKHLHPLATIKTVESVRQRRSTGVAQTQFAIIFGEVALLFANA